MLVQKLLLGLIFSSIIVISFGCSSSTGTGNLALGGDSAAGSGSFSAIYSANSVPQRLQWHENAGYCGETSFQTIGLGYGQYIPQYELRSIASNGLPQNNHNSQLLIGVNDKSTAEAIGLTHSREWTNPGDSEAFLKWIKEQLSQGYPVVIGVLLNKNQFYNDKSSLQPCTYESGGKSTACPMGEDCIPSADPYEFDSSAGDYKKQAGLCQFGDKEYDHIVTVVQVKTNRPCSAPGSCEYDENDRIVIDDHGLFSSECDYGNAFINCPSGSNRNNLCIDFTVKNYVYLYTFRFADFIKTREEANQAGGAIYSLNKASVDYAIALTGLSGSENVPVQVTIERLFECQAITEGTSTKPTASNPPNPDTALTLQAQVNGSNGNYTVYYYKTVADAQSMNHNSPTQSFSCTVTNRENCSIRAVVIDPGEIAIFRAIKSSSPAPTGPQRSPQ